MDGEELFRRYAAGERDFSGVDLSGANLSRVELRDINLSGANLSRVDLSWANLSGANLSGVSASGWGDSKYAWLNLFYA